MFQIKICQTTVKFFSTNSLTRDCTDSFGTLAPSSRSESRVCWLSSLHVSGCESSAQPTDTSQTSLSSHGPFLADDGAPMCTFVVTSSESQEQYHLQYLCSPIWGYFEKTLKKMINPINVTYRLAFYFWVCFVCLCCFWGQNHKYPSLLWNSLYNLKMTSCLHLPRIPGLGHCV